MGAVLELASGTGRLAYPIIELGLDYTGLDSSKEFLKLRTVNLGIKQVLFLGICVNLIWNQLLILFLLVLIHFYIILHSKRCKKLLTMCFEAFKSKRKIFIIYFCS